MARHYNKEETPAYGAGNGMGSPGQADIRQYSFNKLCIAGFVVSCVSMFINPFMIVGIVGMVLSAVGYTKCGEMEGGRRLAVAGIVLGIISIIWGGISIIFAEQISRFFRNL